MVQEQRYLDQLMIYIHLNPVKAGIVADPVEYVWSGHREILGLTRKTIVDVDEVLGVFGRTRRSARAAYDRRLKAGCDEDWSGKSPGFLPWWRLGRPSTSEDEDPEIEIRRKQKGSVDPIDRPLLPVEDFVKLGANAMGLSVEDLRARQRRSEVVSARETLAVRGAERYGLRVVDIATCMNKSPDTITKAIARAAKKRTEGDEYLRVLDQLDAAISIAGFGLNNGGMA